MRFGKTNIEIYEKYEKRRLTKSGKWFAWYPVQLKDGRTVWLEYVYRMHKWLKPILGSTYNYYDLEDVEKGIVKPSQYSG